jgi:hypothetical protein
LPTSAFALLAFASWRLPPGVCLLALMDGLMDRYSPSRGEIDLTDYKRFQKLMGTDGLIIQQGCFDLTAVCWTFFRFLDTPNNQTV